MSLLGALAVGIGGATGALLRALAGRWIQTDFPLATLVVNVSGSFLLALSCRLIPADNEFWRMLIGAGFCGAFTTFSTFILELIILLRSRIFWIAALYGILTVLLCGLASWTGLHLL